MEYHLETPVEEGVLRRLRVGDLVFLSGTIVTARDEAHRKALEIHERGGRLPLDLRG
ncbi:fumarate hydratase, partial [Candidatus Bathyarchaeota archaeon]